MFENIAYNAATSNAWALIGGFIGGGLSWPDCEPQSLTEQVCSSVLFGETTWSSGAYEPWNAFVFCIILGAGLGTGIGAALNWRSRQKH